MPLQPYWAPTGFIFVPFGTNVLNGDIVSGGGIIAGTTVVGIATISGAIGDYLELTLSQTPGPFAAGSVPSGVTDNNQQSTSALTGLNLGYTSNITFSRLTTSSISTNSNVVIPNKTLSFKEDVKGWVSFKSFTPDFGVSLASDYYTMFNGRLFFHNDETVVRNHFYGGDNNSSINVILNDGPGSIKSFHTLSYEGSQSNVDEYDAGAIINSDIQPYNLTAKPGWFVSDIETDKQVGSLNEFIEKEGKWFNYIKGVDSSVSLDTDFGAFNIQGIGILSNIGSDVLTFSGSINTSLQIGDIIYFQSISGNYNSFDTIDSSGINKYGDVTALTKTTVTVNLTGTAPVTDDYIMFVKNHIVNTSSLVGYYADVKFENNSTEKIELFSVGSEITESSK